MRVEMYSKPGCGLCEEAKRTLCAVQQRVPFELVEVNILNDAALFEKFQFDIPVIFIDGHKAFKHRVGEQEFEKRLRRALA